MFERPGDEQLTWYRDHYQTPEPVGPLTQSFCNYMFQEFQRAQRQLGQERPSALRILFVKGYMYVHVMPPGGPRTEAGQKAVSLSWEQEYLPEIKANLAHLDSLAMDGLCDDQLSHALQGAMKVLARHWGIRHSIYEDWLVTMQEEHRFWIDLQTSAAVHRICREFGRRMAAVGILEDPDDVAYLTVPELLRFGFGIAQPHLREVAPERKAEHAANLRAVPAPWVGAPPEDDR